MLDITTFVQMKRGRAMGPVCRHYIGLAEDGTWYEYEPGELIFYGEMIRTESHPMNHDMFRESWDAPILALILPTLMSI